MIHINKNNKRNVWLTGDFNLPHIDWEECFVLPTNPSPTLSNKLNNITNALSIAQIVIEVTKQNNILELLFLQQTQLLSIFTGDWV